MLQIFLMAFIVFVVGAFVVGFIRQVRTHRAQTRQPKSKPAFPLQVTDADRAEADRHNGYSDGFIGVRNKPKYNPAAYDQGYAEGRKAAQNIDASDEQEHKP